VNIAIAIVGQPANIAVLAIDVSVISIIIACGSIIVLGREITQLLWLVLLAHLFFLLLLVYM